MFKRTILLLLLSTQIVSAQTKKEAPFVVPALKSWSGKPGFYELKANTAIVMANQDVQALKPLMQTFLADLKIFSGSNKLQLRTGTPQKGDIYVTLNCPDTALNQEGYILNVKQYISINAKSAKAAFWATRSILQMLEQDKMHKKIAAGIARDYPDYPVRGFVLDVARKFFTIDFLRNYVKFMSYYKMNDFHIHLNDNGFKQFFNDDWSQTYSAFRLENKTYPNLTAKDGSYSKQEFRDLQALAKSYGVNIIPEIDVPAHSLAFTKAVPEIASTKYGQDHLDLSNPKTYEVIDNVFKEYLEGPNPVFTGNEVHIGTDEYSKAESENFRAFTDHYIRFVEKFGKKARVWGALTHAQGKTPVKVKNVTMNLWYNGYADPKVMIADGYDVISTPDGWLYIVPAAGYYYDYLNVQKLYNDWAPNKIGNQTFPVKQPQIKGGSFAVWNDHVGNGISEKDVHHRVFPAMQVLAQKMWTAATLTMPYNEFAQKSNLLHEGPGLNMLGKYRADSCLLLHETFKNVPAKASKEINNAHFIIENGHNSLALKGGNSFYKLPYPGIGYNYTVSFLIKPNTNNAANSVIFSSADAIVKLKQGNSGNLGFSRDGYNYQFNYQVPENVLTKITITGNNKGTSLYVNGVLVEKLEGQQITFPNTKGKLNKTQTLFFPLERIGATKQSFSGYIADLKVYNYILSETEIAK